MTNHLKSSDRVIELLKAALTIYEGLDESEQAKVSTFIDGSGTVPEENEDGV